MSHRLSLLTLLFPFALLGASCTPENQTESELGVVYALDSVAPYEGCIVQTYPDGQKKSELFYHKGKLTGEGRRWFENGPKQSEITHKSGKIYTKKLWNLEGYMYAFERYKDGKRLHPIEMAYAQAIRACQDATFHGHGGWKLPSVKELYKVPFSEETKEMTFIASNPPKMERSLEKVSYVRFGSIRNDGRWDNDDLSINSPLNIICIKEDNPREFHLVMGLNKIPDLTSDYVDGNVKVKALKQAPVAKKKVVKAKTPEQAPVIKTKNIKVIAPKQAPVAKKKNVKVVAPKQAPVEKKKAVKIKTPKQAPVAKKKAVKVKTPEQKPVAKKKVVKQKTLRSGYYISIYTYSVQAPKKTDLDAILNTGYRYKLSDFTRDGKKVKNVLIGPFPTEQKAKKELKRVHRNIKPDAYIIDNTY